MTPHVEFFNPKMRPELEEKDAIEMRKTGAKGPAPGDDTWVWLTSYSRVPVTCLFSLICFKKIDGASKIIHFVDSR